MPTPIVEIAVEFRYESAHWLPHVADDHQCRRMHGHSYHLTVLVKAPVGADGFVVDFADVKAAVAPVISRLDHYLLNDIPGLDNPTVEIQLVWLWEQLNGSIAGLHELRLRETANNSASYRGEVA